MARRSSKRDYERGDRVGELIRRILADEIEGLDDDRLHLLSFTGVEVDNELNVAKVYWSCFEGNDEEITQALIEHRGRLRKAVSSQARIRHTPSLECAPDHGIREGARIEELLRGYEPNPEAN